MSVQVLNDVPQAEEPLQCLVWELNIEDFLKAESKSQQPEGGDVASGLSI